MKIVFCLRNYLPSHVAGTEIYVAALCHELEKMGTENIIVKPGFGKGSVETYFYKGQKIIEYPEAIKVDKELITGRRLPDGLPYFRAILQEEQPDIVHFHEISGSNGITMGHFDIARSLGIPIFTTLHLAGYVCKTGKLLYKNKLPCDGVIKTYKCSVCSLHNRGLPIGMAKAVSATGMLFKNTNLQNSWLHGSFAGLLSYPNYIDQHHRQLNQIFDDSKKVFVLSEWFKQVLLNNQLREDKMVLLPKALPHETAFAIKDSTGAINTVLLRFVFLGRLNKTKGLYLLLEALQSVKSTNWSLDIYGQTEDESYLQQCIALANEMPERVVFKKVLQPSDIPAVLPIYDALVCPTIIEEMVGFVVMEAFAAGVPVIGSDSKGIAEQVKDGVDGFLFRTGSASSLADLLEKILKDPGSLSRLKKNIQVPKKFDVVAQEVYKEYLFVKQALAYK